MTAILIICRVLVMLTTICMVSRTVETCSYYKWRATNPDAFKYDKEDKN